MSAQPETKTTSLAALARPQVSPELAATITPGYATLAGFELAQRIAKSLTEASLVPQSYQGNMSNCMIAVNMAARMNADVLMVMQHLYIVHGRPAWSAQFMVATFNACGRYSTMRYRWAGTKGKDDWSCTAYATERDSGEEITGPTISIAMAKAEGWYGRKDSKWQTIPELMLMYRAGSWLVKTHAPELSLGLQTEDELHDTFDAQRDARGTYTVQPVTPAAEALPAASATPAAPPVESSTERWNRLFKEHMQRLREAGELSVLADAWKAICDDFGEPPLDLEAFYQVRAEELAEKAKEVRK